MKTANKATLVLGFLFSELAALSRMNWFTSATSSIQ